MTERHRKVKGVPFTAFECAESESAGILSIRAAVVELWPVDGRGRRGPSLGFTVCEKRARQASDSVRHFW